MREIEIRGTLVIYNGVVSQLKIDALPPNPKMTHFFIVLPDIGNFPLIMINVIHSVENDYKLIKIEVKVRLS